MSALEFTDALAKGTRLLALLTTRAARADTPLETDPPAATQQSEFTSYADLATHGYMEESSPEPFTLAPLRTCLRGLGVDDRLEVDGGNNRQVYHVHSESVIVDGVWYPSTNAYFSHLVNREEGVLIACSNMSAPHVGMVADLPVDVYPPLHRWSDIAWLQLLTPSQSPSPSARSDTCVSAPPDLRFIIRYSIQNPTTLAVIASILSARNIELLPAWPGLTFPLHAEIGKGYEEGVALLGTPNGAGVAYLLAQHKAQLGAKEVRKVSLFYAKNAGDLYRWPSLVFWVGQEDDGGEAEGGWGEGMEGVEV
ncbi:hypothetical protein BU23DRAFT_258350 [Bimuria novae-zelandiae CBS 107.79]|uniref:Uncharacterized protein n=1 Tax=Bimuria novae-zelandiae CBS 107.79 TaxID=1447943 RepID=A0A6A5V0U5_9PLEO|nr:hypothetical protein BU23DRAFT_258350 [Bimuria novae-zelandiae CBS 107.79]